MYVYLVSIFLFFNFVPVISEPFLLCAKGHIKKHYSFDSPIDCPHQSLSKIKHCSATVFFASTTLKRIPAYICFSQEIRWTTNFYFFGSKFKEVKTIDSPPPAPIICNSWKTTRNTRDGPLVYSGSNTFNTNNKVNFKYTWPTSQSGVIRNHFMLRSYIFYDFYQNSLSSPVFPMSDCEVSMNLCQSPTKTIIWKVKPTTNCPRLRKFTGEDIHLHFNSSSSLYRVEILDLGISIHHWSPCPIRAQHCFSKDILCTRNGMYIAPYGCELLHKLAFSSPKHKHRRNLTSIHYPDSTLTSYINEVEDSIAEQFLHFDEQFRFLHCQLERAFGVMSQTLGRLFPSEILSLALGKPTFGLTAGDALSELNCIPAIGKILPSLAFDNDTKFSLLPLIEFVHPRDGKRSISQLVSPNFIIEGKPSLYENYKPSRSFIFRVNSRFLLFENYTLNHQPIKVEPLHIPLTSVRNELVSTDYTSVLHKISNTQNGITDLHSILSVLSQTAAEKAQIHTAMQLLGSSEQDDANLTQVTNSIQSFAHKTLLLAISEISSPFLTAFIFLLQFLAFAWSIYFSVKFIREQCFPFLLHVRVKFASFHNKELAGSPPHGNTTLSTDEAVDHDDSIMKHSHRRRSHCSFASIQTL